MLSRTMEETGAVTSSQGQSHVNVSWSKYQVPSATTDLKVIERWKQLWRNCWSQHCKENISHDTLHTAVVAATVCRQ